MAARTVSIFYVNEGKYMTMHHLVSSNYTTEYLNVFTLHTSLTDHVRNDFFWRLTYGWVVRTSVG